MELYLEPVDLVSLTTKVVESFNGESRVKVCLGCRHGCAYVGMVLIYR